MGEEIHKTSSLQLRRRLYISVDTGLCLVKLSFRALTSGGNCTHTGLHPFLKMCPISFCMHKKKISSNVFFNYLIEYIGGCNRY